MNYFVFIIPAGIAVGGGVLGFFVARKMAGAALALLWAALALFSLAMGVQAAQPGWDAITYMAIFWAACVPAGLGMLVGSLLGWLGRAQPHAEG